MARGPDLRQNKMTQEWAPSCSAVSRLTAAGTGKRSRVDLGMKHWSDDRPRSGSQDPTHSAGRDSQRRSVIIIIIVMLMMMKRMMQMMWTCADYQLLNSSTCLPSRDHEDRHVTMQCQQGHLIKLVRLTYGHSASTGRCHYLPGDCVTHLVASGNEVACVGLNRCDVNVTSRDHGRPIPGCKLPTDYIHASFQCIPGMRKQELGNAYNTAGRPGETVGRNR